MVSFSGLISVIGRFHRFRDFYFRLLFGTIHPNYNQFQKPGDIGSGLRQLGMTETGKTTFYDSVSFAGFAINGSKAAYTCIFTQVITFCHSGNTANDGGDIFNPSVFMAKV